MSEHTRIPSVSGPPPQCVSVTSLAHVACSVASAIIAEDRPDEQRKAIHDSDLGPTRRGNCSKREWSGTGSREVSRTCGFEPLPAPTSEWGGPYRDVFIAGIPTPRSPKTISGFPFGPPHLTAAVNRGIVRFLGANPPATSIPYPLVDGFPALCSAAHLGVDPSFHNHHANHDSRERWCCRWLVLGRLD